MKAVCEGFSGERESFQEVRLSNWAELGSGIFYSRTDHLDNWNLFVFATKRPNLVWTSSAQTMQPFLPLFPGFSQFPSLPSFFLQGLEKLFSRQNLHSRIKNTDKAVDRTIFATFLAKIFLLEAIFPLFGREWIILEQIMVGGSWFQHKRRAFVQSRRGRGFKFFRKLYFFSFYLLNCVLNTENHNILNMYIISKKRIVVGGSKRFYQTDAGIKPKAYQHLAVPQ